MKHKHLVFALAAAVVCLAGFPAVTPAADEEPEGYRLSMAAALRMALDNNLDLVSARDDPRISEENVVANEAGFDFGLSLGPSHREFKGETSNPSFPNETTTDSANFGLSQALKFGGSYNVDFNVARSEIAGQFQTVPEPASAGVDLSFTLPLIGSSGGLSAGREATTETLTRARGDLEISQQSLRTEVHRVMVDVEDAYWNVVANVATLETRSLALKRSEDLLDLNRKKVKVGTLAPIEITQAEAGVASNEEQLIIAETELENSEDELLRLLGVPPEDPLWNTPIVPTDRPDFVEKEIALDQVIVSALANRPEIRSARRQLENDELSARVARRQTRPFVSLTGRVNPSGNNFETVTFNDPIAGPVAFQVQQGSVDEAIKEIPDFDNYDWNVGVTMNYDIGNRAAKSNYAIKSLTRNKSSVALRNQEQLIRVDARRSVRAVDSGIKRVQAARKNVELQEKKLNAEQKKFENGMSTSFEVLTFQSDLADSQLALIQAGLDYARALTALERSKGTLLESRGLQLGGE